MGMLRLESAETKTLKVFCDFYSFLENSFILYFLIFNEYDLYYTNITLRF